MSETRRVLASYQVSAQEDPWRKPHLFQHLNLHRCPHCAVASPLLSRIWEGVTVDYTGQNGKFWVSYVCSTCGGIITAWSLRDGGEVLDMYPSTKLVDESIPDNAADYLQQALDSLHAPAGAIMLTASAVDSMLKEKNYTKGDLKTRINQAAQDHLITNEMAEWAHEVRLDANAQRHADQATTRPTAEDAKRSIEFALALAEFLFVLPARVKRGRQPAIQTQNP